MGVVTAGIAPIPTGGVQGSYPIALNQGGAHRCKTLKTVVLNLWTSFWTVVKCGNCFKPRAS